MKWHHVLFVALAVCALVVDLATKYLIFRSQNSFTIIPGFLGVQCARNPGAVFGVLAGRKVLLLLFSAVAVVFIFYMQFWGMTRSWLGSVSMGLLLGGALGNIYDRLAFGRVRDFIDVYVGSHHWPTFNFADAFLCVGAGLLILKMFRDEAQTNDSGAGEKSCPAGTENS